MFSAPRVTRIQDVPCAVAQLKSIDGENDTYGFIVAGSSIYFLLADYDKCQGGLLTHCNWEFPSYGVARIVQQNMVILTVSIVTYKIFSRK